MTTLRDILHTLPDTALLKDGASTWTPDNLCDELDADDLAVESVRVGDLIHLIGRDGYQITPAAYRVIEISEGL